MMGERVCFKGFSGTDLKYIGLISMTLSHAGIALAGSQYPQVQWLLNQAGRPAAILYFFLVAEGFCHTSSRKRYLARLMFWGAVSEIPYDLALWGRLADFSRQNIFWTLAIGLAVLWAASLAWGKGMFWENDALAGAALLGCGAAWALHADYDVVGVLLIAWFYWARDSRRRQIAGAFVIFLIFMDLEWIPAASLALVFLWMYNGTRGKTVHPLFFYGYYPVHLGVLAFIRFHS